jgi:tetratricopeptide (TPR) repeat protein
VVQTPPITPPATAPTAVAERLKNVPNVGEVRLWEYPLETIQQQAAMGPKPRQVAADEFLPYAWIPELWRGRVLDFKHKWDGERGAKYYYIECRKANTDLDVMLFPPRPVSNSAKENASLHMGLIAFEEQGGVKPGERKYESAIDYFSQRALATFPDGSWNRLARYNLGRSYEAAGDKEKAIAILEQGIKGAPWPQEIGDKLRARRLKSKG